MHADYLQSEVILNKNNTQNLTLKGEFPYLIYVENRTEVFISSLILADDNRKNLKI